MTDTEIDIRGGLSDISAAIADAAADDTVYLMYNSDDDYDGEPAPRVVLVSQHLWDKLAAGDEQEQRSTAVAHAINYHCKVPEYLNTKQMLIDADKIHAFISGGKVPSSDDV